MKKKKIKQISIIFVEYDLYFIYESFPAVSCPKSSVFYHHFLQQIPSIGVRSGIRGNVRGSGRVRKGSTSQGRAGSVRKRSGSRVGGIGRVDDLRVVRSDHGRVSNVGQSGVSGGVGRQGRCSRHQRGAVGQGRGHQSGLGTGAGDGQRGNEELQKRGLRILEGSKICGF